MIKDTYKMINSEEVNSLRWSSGSSINLKRNALSDKGAVGVEEGPGHLVPTLSLHESHSTHGSHFPW